MMPKLFGPIAERYRERPGGYTRVLRIEPLKTDQAPSAILELVDGPRDMRFTMTAKTIARSALRDQDLSDITLKNIRKVTRFRPGGEDELEMLVAQMKRTGFAEGGEPSPLTGVLPPKPKPKDNPAAGALPEAGAETAASVA